MEKYIEQIKEKNDCTPLSLDPHIPAATLKQWLRELTSPVIPDMYYSECIKIGSSPQPNPADVLRVVELIPSPNRAIMHTLACLVRQVCSSENIGFTRMSVANLAIVFAPCVLRTSVREDTDIASFMQNSKLEINFIATFFQACKIDSASVSWMSSLAFASFGSSGSSWYPPTQSAGKAGVQSYQVTAESETLPPHWERCIDEEGNEFYYNNVTGVSQWELPEK
jgi:hypothetical protein